MQDLSTAIYTFATEYRAVVLTVATIPIIFCALAIFHDLIVPRSHRKKQKQK